MDVLKIAHPFTVEATANTNFALTDVGGRFSCAAPSANGSYRTALGKHQSINAMS